jgi:phosphoribosylanthranilate isomerase
LAGGLGPDNVRDAIELVRPFGVDSETKTSTVEDRRRKDLEQVERFIRLARATVDDVPR